jgi:hypothetical protein
LVAAGECGQLAAGLKQVLDRHKKTGGVYVKAELGTFLFEGRKESMQTKQFPKATVNHEAVITQDSFGHFGGCLLLSIGNLSKPQG